MLEHISKLTLTISRADSAWQRLADHPACPTLYSLSDSAAVQPTSLTIVPVIPNHMQSRVKKSLLELCNTWQITKQLNAVKRGESMGETSGGDVVIIIGWY